MRAAVPGGNQRELLVKFKVQKFLGKGSYGSVFQVQRLGDGQTYALKEMDVRAMSQPEREDATNEVRLLASVNHPNVIAYHEAFLDGNRLCIIMEYAPDGDLSKVIKKWQMMRRPMPEDLVWKYFIQVARGLHALHQMRILHRDIKPGNIMIMAGDVAKIGDLGIAKLLKNTIAAKTQIGTPHYMPPEIWKNKPYAYASDSWALGCLLYEMATFSVPFEARSMNELRYKVLRGSYPPVPNTYSRELQEMVRQCLDPEPTKRPSMDAILGSPAVSSRAHLVDSGRAIRPPSTAGTNIIDTIKVPRGNFGAIKGRLPPANYGADGNILGPGAPEGMANGNGNGHGARPEVLEVARLPPGLPNLKSVVPTQAAPPPVKLPNGMLPRIPNARPADQNGGLPQQVPGLQQRPPPLATPSSVAPSAAPGRAGGAAAANMWYPGKAAGGAAGTPVSESHAAYGAFYRVSPTAAAAAAVKAKVFEDARLAGNGARPAQPQAYNQYYNPYANNNQQRAAYQASPGVRLPGLGMQIPGGLPPAAPNRAAQAGAGVAAAGGGRPPPWNYGAQGGARAAALAYAAHIRQQAMGGGGGGAGGGDNLGAGAGISRYPPPQWNAPRPARY